jgi:hypothetical protein
MDFAFSENAPKPSTLGKSHTLIAKLWQYCADISEQLSNAQAKLQTNSSNSSLPPSSDSIREKAERRNNTDDDWKFRTEGGPAPILEI